MASAPEPEENASTVSESLTIRAFVLGLITIAGMCLYATYFGRNLMKSFVPVTALLPLVLWVGINTVLKLIFTSLCPVAHRSNGDFWNGLDGGYSTGSGLGRVLDYGYFSTVRFFFTGKPILGGGGGLYAPVAVF